MATLNLQVGASADDAFEDIDGNVSLTDTAFNVDELDEWGGARWTGASALNGATLTSATCQFYITSSTLDEPDIVFYGNDVDNAATFAGTAANISGRTKTTATVAWSSADLGSSGGFATSPSIVSILNEMIASGFLASGVFAILWTCVAGGTTRDFGIDTYNNSSARGAKLDVVYTAGGGAIKGRVGLSAIECGKAGLGQGLHAVEQGAA